LAAQAARLAALGGNKPWEKRNAPPSSQQQQLLQACSPQTTLVVADGSEIKVI
jgi:hypothetical protein